MSPGPSVLPAASLTVGDLSQGLMCYGPVQTNAGQISINLYPDDAAESSCFANRALSHSWIFFSSDVLPWGQGKAEYAQDHVTPTRPRYAHLLFPSATAECARYQSLATVLGKDLGIVMTDR